MEQILLCRGVLDSSGGGVALVQAHMNTMRKRALGINTPSATLPPLCKRGINTPRQSHTHFL
jgi:hypothetical protein